jgi:hypothetical protein
MMVSLVLFLVPGICVSFVSPFSFAGPMHEILWQQGAVDSLIDFLNSEHKMLQKVAVGALFGLLDYGISPFSFSFKVCFFLFSKSCIIPFYFIFNSFRLCYFFPVIWNFSLIHRFSFFPTCSFLFSLARFEQRRSLDESQQVDHLFSDQRLSGISFVELSSGQDWLPRFFG